MIFLDANLEVLADSFANTSASSMRIVSIDESCGAVAVISKAKYPPTTPELVKKHNDDGSIFISLADYFITREASVSKLVESEIKNKMLLFFGDIKRKAGYVKIGDHVNLPERDFLLEKLRYSMMGFHVFEFPTDYVVPFMEELDRYVTEQSYTEVFPSYIENRVVGDWRATVATFPLVGINRANTLYEKYGGRPFLDALFDITNPELNQAGIGKVICDQVRDWIGIPDGFRFSLIHESEE